MMEIRFPGGLAVAAEHKGHTILTDQPTRAGGDDRGPAPFDLFLASIGTCAGFYALAFCKQRGIDTTGLKLTLEPVRHPEEPRLSQIKLRIHLPEGFPEKYQSAIVRAADQCAVKRHIVDHPPELVTESVAPGA